MGRGSLLENGRVVLKTFIFIAASAHGTVAHCQNLEATARNDSPVEFARLIERAWHAWESGDVRKTHALARNLAEIPSTSAAGFHLLSYVALVKGDYEKSLGYHRQIDANYPRYSDLDRPMIEALTHLGRYGDALAFAKGRGVTDEWTVASLGYLAANPPSVELHSVSIIPFLDDPFTQYIPAFSTQINGRQVISHLDTGGTHVVMSPELASELGIATMDVCTVGHANGVDTKMCRGSANMRLGEARLTNIPVLTVESLPPAFKRRAIFGTSVLQQFLSTIDYPHQRLVLSPRHDLRQNHLSMLPRDVVRMPFFMWSDHYMFARGSFGGFEDLNLFIDSGLCSVDGNGRQAAFQVNTDKLEDWGFDPVFLQSHVFFAVEEPISLGALHQTGQLLVHGRKSTIRSLGGVRIDGLLGHAFLKQYAWTIDFAKHEYLFHNPLHPSGE